MNTAKQYDQQQQQGYRPPPNMVAAGRPLPKTPGVQQQLDPSMPTSTSSGSSFIGNSSFQSIGNGINDSNIKNDGVSARSSRASIHLNQTSIAPASSNNFNTTTTTTTTGTGTTATNNSNTTNSRNAPWIQPTSFSNIQTTYPTGVNSNTGYQSYSNTPLGRKSQQYLGQSQQQQQQQQHEQQQQQQQQQSLPRLSQDEESSYYAALTRPISPTMVMGYIPPPTSSGANSSVQNESTLGSPGHPIPPPVTSTISSATASSFGPHSATAALSSSFNTLGPGSQPKPAIHQSARNSYVHPTTSVPGPGSNRTQQGTNSIDPEDPTSSSSRFARRGPLIMSHDIGSFGDGTRSRRESAAYSDNMDNPVSYRQQFQTQQQAFNPSSQRTDGSGAQLQVAKEGWLWRRGNLLTWKRCYAIGRYRGDANPGIMTLFKDNEHLFPIKSIDMAECLEVQVKGQDAKATGRFEFKVVTRKEEIWFATDTMSERTGWIDALNSLMAKVVGASLMKLEAKLNNIRQRNNSFEYTQTSAGAPSNEKATVLEGQLQLVQQDLVSREQLLSQREQELDRKRAESLLVQLEAWRAAAKVTVNQHYAVRDQLLERVMKTARTVQELIERARIHLETGSDQITEVVNSHLECLKVHAGESSMNSTSYKMLKSILVGLSVNLDTRSSEIKRVLLTLDQYISATKSSTSTSTPASPTSALPPTSTKDRRMSVGASFHSSGPPPPASSASVGITVYLIQVRGKYKETLEILEDHSRRLKRILERADINDPETARRFHEEAKDLLKGLLKLPSYVFTPCLPDQPLPGAADTFYREDLVQIQQKSKELQRKGHSFEEPSLLRQASGNHIKHDGSEPAAEGSATEESTPKIKQVPTTPATASANSPPKLALALPASLSSFLLTDNNNNNNNTHGSSAADLTQKLRDTILPEFDHLSVKQEESLQSMTSLLNQISSVLVSKLAEIKDATAGQRQEFEELKDEIIDMMQLSATDPSAHQRDVSALSEIRSKLAEITEQLVKVQSSNSQAQQGFLGSGNNGSYNGNRRLIGQNGSGNATGSSAAIKTGFSLLQRSASTMAPSSFRSAHPFYHTIDSGPRQHLQRVNSTSLQNRLQIPSSVSLTAGFAGTGLASLETSGAASTATVGGKHPKIAGMARLFEDGDGLGANDNDRQHPSRVSYFQDYDYDQDSRQHSVNNQEVVSKLDQLLLLLEFVNTAQCRMMAYQDLEFDRNKSQGSSNVDDGRMMAVQDHMEQMDRKMNMQIHLLRRLATLHGSGGASAEEPLAIPSAQIQEIKDEGVSGEFNDEIDNAHLESVADMRDVKRATVNQPGDDLSFLDVLSRLDLQVIPFVKDQSSRIQELSDQLSEMKRQLDEQQRRQEQPRSPLPPRVSTSIGLGRSNSLETPAVPMLRSRSPSQTFVQQQQSITPLSPALEDSPSSWRASLRPSHSTGSSSASFKDRAFSAVNASPLNNSTSANSTPLSSASVTGSQSNQDGLILSKTSDRIAEILDRMDTRMGQMIDEQLSRYEKGNKELIAKVHELLETDGDEAEGRVVANRREKPQEDDGLAATNASSSAVISESDLAPLQQKLQGIEQILTLQTDQNELRQVENKALWKEIGASLDELHGYQAISKESQQQLTKDVKETLEQVLRGQEELLSKSAQNHSVGSTGETVQESVESTAKLDLTESFEKIKSLIQQEADRSEFSLNEQRDEILEKMNQIMSSIQESQADVGSRDAAVREELQDMRGWIVKHSSMQTENLREIVFASISTHTDSETARTTENGIPSGSVDSESDAVVIGGNGSGFGSEEEYTRVDILDDLDRDPLVHDNSHTTPLSSRNQNQPLTGPTKEIQELKEQLEMFTKLQMATFSELADNVSGIEKMMLDMSKTMGVRRGGTILRKKEADQDRAMLAAEVKETIEEVMTRMKSSSSVPQLPGVSSNSLSGSPKGSASRSSLDSGDDKASPVPPTSSAPANGPSRVEGGLLKYIYQPRRPTSVAAAGAGAPQPPSRVTASSPLPIATGKPLMNVDTSLSHSDTTQSPPPTLSPSMDYSEDEVQLKDMEVQLNLYHDQMEQLYRRKARVEIEVENLQSEKTQLSKENEDLRNQVEQLRREKQDLLLSRCSGSSEETIVEQPSSTSAILEKALSDRVAMLLQETARLEALKKQLESETE